MTAESRAISAGLLSAATAWLIITLVAEGLSGLPAAPVLTWAVAIPAFAGGFAPMPRAVVSTGHTP
ncbi:hypothetical protein Acor_55180 [Acrocarpospora corrugata]|uniref:Uncharacterized protein n=1 Tax=Acrocarpospora corrugata TaxID=35763 RepID=A0A5M3W5Z3_9ACTN|nr:hypothetical protein [Acrocarpospora corrugata]GES03452.1 hypothetical protein Acor_55180 [Acrocarpospora corrugata]